MAKINGVEIKNFNPNAKTYNDCIKNTQAIQKVIDDFSFKSHRLIDSAGTAGESGRGKMANYLVNQGYDLQDKVNMLTRERKKWELKATQTPEGKAKEQNRFAKEQKKAKEDKVRRQIINAIFPKR